MKATLLKILKLENFLDLLKFIFPCSIAYAAIFRCSSGLILTLNVPLYVSSDSTTLLKILKLENFLDLLKFIIFCLMSYMILLEK